MGTTFHNYHVRTENVATVQKALEQIGGIAWITAAPLNGWISVYTYRLSLEELVHVLPLPLISLEIYDDEIATYQVFENGLLVGEYDSYSENSHAPEPGNIVSVYSEVQTLLEKSVHEAFIRALKFVKERHINSDAFAITRELFRVLGLEKRFLYTGYGVVLESDFPLLLVGEKVLTQEELTGLLMQSVSKYPEINMAAMRNWLALGANPNGLPRANVTPLMRAIESGCIEAVRILLEAGASTDLNYYDSGLCADPPVAIAYSSLEITKSVANADEIHTLLRAYEVMKDGA